MVTKTPNLGLSKPAGTDFVDINVLNGNMDVLDTQVAGKLDKSGGTMTGQLADVKKKQVRNVVYSTSEPTDLADGDIWVSPGGLPDANGVQF